MNQDKSSTSHPTTPKESPYTLQVSSREEALPNGETITRRWAGLFRFNPNEPVSDANPCIREYIQQRPIPPNEDGLDREPVACDMLQTKKKHMLENQVTEGWETNRDIVADFIETVRDEYYLAEISQDELQIKVDLPRIDSDKTEYSDTAGLYNGDEFSIYFRDSAGEIEYVMWHSHEIYNDHHTNDDPSNMNHSLLQKVLVGLANAYEEPSEFIQQWAHHKVQLNPIENT